LIVQIAYQGELLAPPRQEVSETARVIDQVVLHGLQERADLRHHGLLCPPGAVEQPELFPVFFQHVEKDELVGVAVKPRVRVVEGVEEILGELLEGADRRSEDGDAFIDHTAFYLVTYGRAGQDEMYL